MKPTRSELIHRPIESPDADHTGGVLSVLVPSSQSASMPPPSKHSNEPNARKEFLSLIVLNPGRRLAATTAATRIGSVTTGRGNGDETENAKVAEGVLRRSDRDRHTIGEAEAGRGLAGRR